MPNRVVVYLFLLISNNNNSLIKIPLLFDMMSSELLFTKPDVIDDNQSIIDVLKVPNKLVTQLDLHFENGAGDYGFRDSFKKM